MATQYTSLLGLALPVTGELSGSWGDTVNTAITSLLDTAVAGTTSITVDADITLTTTTGLANQARQAIILWNPASGTTTRNITAPAQSKIYTVINASGGTQSIVFRGAGPTTGVTIVKGESAVVAWNGSDFIKVSNTGGSASFTNVTVSGTTTLSGLTASTALALDASKNVVSVTNTGTGNNVLSASPTLTGTVAAASLSLSSLTATRVPFAGVAGLLSDSANMTFNGTRLTVADLADSGLTSGRVTYASTGGALVDSANFTFNGTDLTVSGAVNAGSINATTLDLTNLEVTNIKAKDGTASITLADSTGIATFSKATVVSTTDNTNAALRITQLGTGNALVVEDSTNPDASPFVVDATGDVLIGSATPIVGAFSDQAKLQIAQNTGEAVQQNFTFLNSSAGSYLYLSKSRNGAIGTNTVVQNGDDLGGLVFAGADGTTYHRGASITASVDGVPGTNDMPGRLVFATTADGGVNPTERMRIDSSGNLGIGTSSPSFRLDVRTGTNSSVANFQQTGASLNTDIYINNAGSANNFLISRRSNGESWLYNSGADPLVFSTNAAERMRINSAGNVGIGTSSPAARLDVSGNAQASNLYINVSAGTLGMADNTASILAYNATGGGGFTNSLRFLTNGAARMILDGSGNVGIGTSSPTQRLRVVGTSGTAQFGAGTAGNAVFINAFDSGDLYMTASATNSTLFGFGAASNIPLAFLTNNTERMRLDSSGNLGLGVTPSVWHPATDAFQFGTSGGFVSGRTNGTAVEFGSNAFRNAASNAWIYTTTAAATLYEQNLFGNGSHVWYNAPSGTAGNTVTFAQAMTLNASGNLGLGVTPSAWSTAASIKAIQNPGGSFWNLSTNNVYVGQNYYWDGTNRVYITTAAATEYNQGSGQHRWFTAPSGTAGNAITFTQAMTLDASGNLFVGKTASALGTAGIEAQAVGYFAVTRAERPVVINRLTTDGDMIELYRDSVSKASLGVTSNSLTFGVGGSERARITSGGNFGIGQTSPQTALGFANTATISWGTTNYPFISGDQPNNALTFGTQATERARIDSSGNLLVGKTTTGVGTVGFAAKDYIEVTRDGNPVAYFTRLNSDGDAVQFRRSSGAAVGSISVTTTATAYNTSSDYRLKNTIAPMTGALAKVALLKPCTYKWNADGSDGEGFVAHELAEVVPQAVTGEKDAVDAEGKPVYQGIDTSFLVATLTAAIQELKAEFDAYKASHP